MIICSFSFSKKRPHPPQLFGRMLHSVLLLLSVNAMKRRKNVSVHLSGFFQTSCLFERTWNFNSYGNEKSRCYVFIFSLSLLANLVSIVHWWVLWPTGWCLEVWIKIHCQPAHPVNSDTHWCAALSLVSSAWIHNSCSVMFWVLVLIPQVSHIK